MAKKKTASPKHVTPKDESQDVGEEEGGGQEGLGRKTPTSKSDAVRMAIAAGFDGPQDGSGYIQSQFGLDVSPGHFSAVKAGDKKKVLTEAPKGKPGRKPKAAIDGHSAPPPMPSGKRQADLLAAIEAMKPLVEALGKEQAHRIVDLLG